jgi:hypothetical protein
MGMTPPHSFVLIMTVMIKVTVVELGILAVMMKLNVVGSGTMETRKCLQNEVLSSLP